MTALGWRDVSVLAGGIAAWAAAGYPLYEGVHVPSKAFAEVVEHESGTPWITAEELKRMIDAGENIALFDSRSYAEFRDNSIPTAISVPGAELVYRFDDLVTSPDTLVVVNCGGRTRSIIGAQALINAGVHNRVVSLRNGTQDWHLAGYQVLRGRTARMPSVSPEGHETARARAAAMAERFGVKRIDAATVAVWRAEADASTLYVFDVRDPEEYESGHIPGMKHVAGGQLVQETDRHAATWGARIVCVDDDGVRAVVTAHWLIQMGWEAAALTLDPQAMTGATGPWQPTVLGFGDSVPSMTAAELRQRLDRDEAVVIDLDWSRLYRSGHIPGAWYGIRSRLDAILPTLPAGRTVVVTSSDGALSRLAAREHSLVALEGGTRAWAAAGLKLETGATRLATPQDDMRLRAREQEGGVEAAMRAYLAWEINLAAQMAADTDHRFRIMRG